MFSTSELKQNVQFCAYGANCFRSKRC